MTWRFPCLESECAPCLEVLCLYRNERIALKGHGVLRREEKGASLGFLLLADTRGATQGVAPAYSDLLSAVSAGSKTFGERIAESPAFKTFLLKREAAEAVGDFPATDVDKQVGAGSVA